MACMQYDAAQIVTYESRNYSEMRSSLAASLATCLQTFARQVRPPHYGTRTAEELPHQRDREWGAHSREANPALTTCERSAAHSAAGASQADLAWHFGVRASVVHGRRMR